MAKKEKSSFVVHYSKANQVVDELTDEEAGALFKALINYEIHGEPHEFSDRCLRMIYKSMCFDLDENRKKYKETCERREESIRKRWEKESTEAPEKVRQMIDKALK